MRSYQARISASVGKNSALGFAVTVAAPEGFYILGQRDLKTIGEGFQGGATHLADCGYGPADW